MSATVTIRGASLVLPDRVVVGDMVLADGVIEAVGPDLGAPRGEVVDGTGLTALPGLVDTLVSLPMGHDDGTILARDTGAAVAAGITSILLVDLLGTITTPAAVANAADLAARHARTHAGILANVDPDHPEQVDSLSRAAGLHVPIGQWAGSTTVPLDALDRVMPRAPRLVVAEGEAPEGLAARLALYADATDPAEHSRIHTVDLAADALEILVRAARKHGRRVHLGRVSSAAELARLDALGLDLEAVTGQITGAHLFLDAETAYGALRQRAVTTPPVRPRSETLALWAALRARRPGAVGSGHVAVATAAKDAPYPGTARGLPMLSAWLPLWLDRVVAGELTLHDVATLASEGPARRLGLARVGRLEVGFDADVVLVDLADTTLVGESGRAWSGWSPFGGRQLRGKVVATFLRGRPAFRDGRLVDGIRGAAITASRS